MSILLSHYRQTVYHISVLIHIQLWMALGQLGYIPACFSITHKYSETEDVWYIVITENCEWRGVVCRLQVQGRATEFTCCGEVLYK